MLKSLIQFLFSQSSGGQTIIFAEKKNEVSELSGLLAGSRALHGEIPQAQREVCIKLYFKLSCIGKVQ